MQKFYSMIAIVSLVVVLKWSYNNSKTIVEIEERKALYKDELSKARGELIKSREVLLSAVSKMKEYKKNKRDGHKNLPHDILEWNVTSIPPNPFSVTED